MQHANEQINEFTLFIQKNQRFYLEKFSKIEETGKSISWNWAAFFMGIHWMIYRKMYLKAAAFFLLSYVASSTPYIGFILNLGVLIGIAVYANALYLDHVSNNVEKAKILFPDELDSVAKKIGGTNLTLTVCIFIIQILLASLI